MGNQSAECEMWEILTIISARHVATVRTSPNRRFTDMTCDWETIPGQGTSLSSVGVLRNVA
jgi:hypothetical protein